MVVLANGADRVGKLCTVLYSAAIPEVRRAAEGSPACRYTHGRRHCRARASISLTQAQMSIRNAASLNRRDFFAAVVAEVRTALPADLAGFRHRANSMLLKIDYGNERVHYEVWTDGARGRVEIGLHFEDGPASTLAYLAFFDARIVEIKHALGPEVELERWTASWGHLFESAPLGRLDRGFARSVAGRLTAQIALLQPMVEEAAIPAAEHEPQATSRQRWRRKGGAAKAL